MTGTMEIKKFPKNAKYFVSGKDYDERIGGEFWMFIEPFESNGNEPFFYLNKNEDGTYQIEGEGYIVTSKESLEYHKRIARKKGAGKTIRFIERKF